MGAQARGCRGTGASASAPRVAQGRDDDGGPMGGRAPLGRELLMRAVDGGDDGVGRLRQRERR